MTQGNYACSHCPVAEPKPGDIGLVRIKGIVGWLIQLGEFLYDFNWQWSHAFIYLGDGLIMEAEPGGARIAPLSEYDGAVLWSTRELTDQQRTDIVAAARSFEGIGYNYLDYLALAAWRFRLRFPFVKRRIEDTSRLICSQLDDYAWFLGHVHIFNDGRAPGFVTPGALGREIRDGRL